MSNKKQIQFTDKLLSNLEEIKEKNGLATLTAVIHYCIILAHKSEFKDYIVAKGSNMPENKAKSEEVVKKATTDANTNICTKLGGEVSKDNNGALVCDYYTYNKKNRYEQKVPLNSINEDLLSRQFFPDKATVKVLQEEGKVNY